jgi:MoxR-like ATPase
MDERAQAALIEKESAKFQSAKKEIARVIVGQEELLDSLMIGLLADGHMLLEGLPGLAKTLAVNTLAKVLGCEFKRIQFTPDLLPADLIGTSIYNAKEGDFKVSKGPIFTDILLADEINRAPAKVQSALLEVMQERQVTIAGEAFKTGNPYLVLATQNPIEQEGTYPLPEAQTDRFMFKVKISYPSFAEEKEVMSRMGSMDKKPEVAVVLTRDDILTARTVVNSVYMDEKVIDYILKIIFASRQPEKYGVDIAKYLQFGASPRASLAFKVAGKASAFLAGRSFVTPNDIKNIAHNILRHRLRRSYEAEAAGITADDLIDLILKAIPVP